MSKRLLSFGASQLKNYFKDAKNFESNLKKVNILSLEKGKCVAELNIEEEHCNALGGLHGGFSATLVDCISSYALMSLPKGNKAHVSVNINMSYLKSAKEGQTILIEADTIRCGG